MLVVISPAKKLDWAEQAVTATQPAFQKDAISLAKTARNLTLGDTKKLMHLSDALAKLTLDRFKEFEAAPDADLTRPAALAFAGDTYQGLEAATLDADEMAYAQDHLRILSGLYGVLRPLDAIQPYRLEMGSRLKTRRGKNLYDYWGDGPAQALNAHAEAVGADVLVNCASQEYFGAVSPKALNARIVTPQFMEDKGDGKGPKIVSFYAKKARGAMARFVVQKRLTDVEALQDFDTGGYAFDGASSTPEKPVFVRAYPSS